MPERRRDMRIAIYYGQDQQTLMANYSVNMSTGGMFIESADVQPVGTEFVIKFKLPDDDLIITCRARVAWTNENGNLKKFSLPPGMGIQFIDLSLESLHAIQNFLKISDLKPIW